jgi:glycosyltransferase involved in cell wall biosynthesis
MFSVLMCVYHGDNPGHLDVALQSLAASRVRVPEVVIVIDQSTPAPIEAVIDRHRALLPIVTVKLETRMSLGEALNVGLERASHSLVARFDSDDLIVPDRFEKQLSAFAAQPSLDILGGAIAEFDEDPSRPYALRKVPLTHGDIVARAKWRNPFNHMTVMYRKSAVTGVSGYLPRFKSEDYDLWVRMLHAGHQAANLPDVLVNARAGKAMAARRGGWHMLRTELAIQRRFLSLGFLTPFEFARNLVIRGTLQALPSSLRHVMYRAFLRHPPRGDASNP